MKRVLLGLSLGIILIGLIGVVSAIPDPAPVYCQNMNYTANATHCIFNENESCKLWDFYNGDCGQEYVKDLPCRSRGQAASPGYECCENLTTIGHGQMGDNGQCNMQVGGWSICAPCGNGVCDSIENECTCEKDCGNDDNNETETDDNETEIDDDSGNQTKERERKRLKQTVMNYLNSTECPEDCVCAGSTIKCETENGREMTVVAGKSGNVIIITKTANASTSVVLIKNATGIYGNFAGKVKKIKYMPDEIKERVLKKLKITNATSYNMTLKEDGSYEMTIDGKYNVLWLFPKKTMVVTGINSETGEVIVLKKPFWKFRAD